MQPGGAGLWMCLQLLDLVKGAIGGILMSQATGWTLELTGSYVPIVLYAGCAYAVALLAIHLLVPRMEPVAVP